MPGTPAARGHALSGLCWHLHTQEIDLEQVENAEKLWFRVGPFNNQKVQTQSKIEKTLQQFEKNS